MGRDREAALRVDGGAPYTDPDVYWENNRMNYLSDVPRVFLDLETQSSVDIKQGLKRYAQCASVLTAAVAVDDQRVVSVDSEAELAAILRRVRMPAEQRHVPYESKEVCAPFLVVSHNAAFEYAILSHAWPSVMDEIHTQGWVDTMLMARALNLPGGLEKLHGALLPTEHGKLKAGAAMVKSNATLSGIDDPEELRAYCRQDVEMTRRVYNALAPHTCGLDIRLAPVDIAINARGWPVDVSLCKRVRDRIAKKRRDLDNEVTRKGYAATLGGATGDYLLARRTKVKELAKGLDGPQADELLAMADTDAQLASAQAKWQAGMESDMTGGRACYVLSARHTHSGRWAGRAIQPHNFKRHCDDELLDTRRMIAADAGKVLVVTDYRQMELRLGMHLARATKMVDALNDGEDVYQQLADEVMGGNQATPQLRYFMKSVILGLMYGQGKAATQDRIREAGASEDVIAGIYGTLETYLIPKLHSAWKRLMRALDANRGKLTLGGDTCSTFLRLPVHGRLLVWHGYDNSDPDNVTYMSWEGGGWTKRRLWGAKAFAHVVSGLAADIMAAALIRIERTMDYAGAKIVGHVHDEIIVECPGHVVDNVQGMVEALMRVPIGRCMLDVETGTGKTWSKAK